MGMIGTSNIKKLILFMVVSVFMLSMTSFVSAEQWTANFTGAGAGDGSALNYNGPDFVYSEGGRNTTYMPNMRNVVVSFQVLNYNLTANITSINITLPTNTRFIADSNTSAYSNDSDLTPYIAHFVNDSSASQDVLTYSKQTSANISWIAGYELNQGFNFSFNMSVNFTSDTSLDFVVVATYNTSTGAPRPSSYTVDDYIRVDITAPTLSSAVTINKSSFNLTFNENMSAANKAVLSLNITKVDGLDSSVYNVSSLPTNTLASYAGVSADGIYGQVSNVLVLSTAAYFPSDATPYVGINGSTLYDRANNSATAAYVQASDKAGPTVVSISYNHNNKQLAFEFDENVSSVNDRTAILISYGKVGFDNLTLSVLVSESTTQTNYTNLTISDTDRNNISQWESVTLRASLLNRSFITDTGSNFLLAEDGSALDYAVTITHVKDTTIPTIGNWTYSHTSRNVTIWFSELMNKSSVLTQKIIISNKSDHSAGAIDVDLLHISTITIGSIDHATSVTFTLNSTAVDTIASWDRNLDSALYLSINNSISDLANVTAKDIAGNVLSATGAENSSGMTVTTWTQDSTAPTILTVTMSDSNITTDGLNTFTVTFSENISNSTVPTLRLSHSDGTYTAITTGFADTDTSDGDSIMTFSFPFNQATGDGEWNLTIRGAIDISGNVPMATTGPNWTQSTVLFTLDTTAPSLLYAYYLENGTTEADQSQYNGTAGPGDTLVLVFDEVLAANAVGAILDNNFTFSDGGTFCTSGNNCSLSVPANGKAVYITTNRTHTLQLRGDTAINFRYNGMNGSALLIRDLANHAPLNTTSKVIADYAVSIARNTRTTISFPTYVNGTLMGAFLPTTTAYSFIDWVNEASWGSDVDCESNTNCGLKPLVGYRFLWNNVSSLATALSSDAGDTMFRIYLLNQSSTGTQDIEASVDSGWNLLASDGLSTASPDKWLRSLCTADGCATGYVNSFWTYDGLTGYDDSGSSGFNDWDTWTTGVQPYTGYWVSVGAIGTSTTTFSGRGMK